MTVDGLKYIPLQNWCTLDVCNIVFVNAYKSSKSESEKEIKEVFKTIEFWGSVCTSIGLKWIGSEKNWIF